MGLTRAMVASSLDQVTEPRGSGAPRALVIVTGRVSTSNRLVNRRASTAMSIAVGTLVTFAKAVSAVAPATAMIRAVPTPRAMARPSGSRRTNAESGVRQSTVVATGSPRLFRATAWKMRVSPTLVASAESGEIVTETGSLLMDTLAVSAPRSRAATTRAVPMASAVTSPSVLTRARSGSSVNQAGLAPCSSAPSESNARAVSCTWSPTDVSEGTGRGATETCVARWATMTDALSLTAPSTAYRCVEPLARETTFPGPTRAIMVVSPTDQPAGARPLMALPRAS
jgi:hypothetical protein